LFQEYIKMPDIKPLTIKEIEYIKTIPMLFILGRERSGTSLLQNLLDAHPNVIGAPESKFIAIIAPRFAHIKKWTELNIRDFANLLYVDPMFSEFWHLDKEVLTENLLQSKDITTYELLCKIVYYQMRKDKENITLISDKNPPYILHIKTLLHIFPEANFIHIIREPRDNVYSQMKAFHKKDPLFNAQKWLSYNKIVENYKVKMPDRFHTIIYEKMVTDTETIMKSLCEFLKIPYMTIMIENVFPEWLNAHLERKGTLKREETAHKGLLSPINTSNVGKWKNKLSLYDQAAIETITADFANKVYGYDIHLDPNNSIKIPVLRVLKAKCRYFAWQTFSQLKYKSFWFNLMYTRRKQKRFKNMPIWEYF
jgi:hypothetical protein